MNEDFSIDASDLMFVPLHCLEELVFGFDAGALGSGLFLDVIRYVAVMMICGMEAPKEMTPEQAFRRGMDMLTILRAHAQLRTGP